MTLPPATEGIATALVRSIRESTLASATLDVAEVLGDAALETGIVRDIPVLGVISGMRDASRRIAEELFDRKLLAFLRALHEVPREQRQNMLARLDRESGFEARVGERMVAMLQRLDDGEKAELLGRVFTAYARDQIDGYILTRLVRAIDRTDLVDLLRLPDFHLSGHADDLTLAAFVAVGLAHAPHGMATVHYVENSRLCHPMLRFVLREVV